MQLFIVGETIFSKKINMFFALEHTKKAPSKVAHNRPIFFSVLTRLQKRPKNRNPVPPKAPKCRTGYLDWGSEGEWLWQ